MAVAETLGFMVVPIVLVVIGYRAARSINKSRAFDDQVKWPIVVGAILALVMVVSRCAPTQNGLSTATDGVYVETVDGVLSEPLPYQTEIEQKSLDEIEKYTKEKVVQFLKAKNWEYPDPEKFESSVQAIEYDRKTLIRSRFRAIGYFDFIIHEGVVHGRIKTVICVARGRANIRFEGSKCAEVVNDAFAGSELPVEKL